MVAGAVLTPLRRGILALAFLVLLAAPRADARVFWLEPGGDGLLAGAPAGGMRRAYATSLRLNEGRGSLEVWGVDRDLRGVEQLLRERAAALGGACFVGGRGEMRWGVAVADGRVHRVLALAAQGNYALVYQLSQTFAEYQASLRPPESVPLEGVPSYPGGTASSFLANEKSGLAVAALRAPAAALEARVLYRGLLLEAGWQRLAAGGGDAAIFVRGQDCLVVSIKSAGAEGGALITLLHRRLQRAETDRL